MKHSCLSWAVGVMFGSFALIPTLANANQDYLHFVNHRDVNGKLMIPKGQAKASTKHSTQEDSDFKKLGQKELDMHLAGHRSQNMDKKDPMMLSADKAKPAQENANQVELSQATLAQEKPAQEESIIKKTVIPAQPKAFTLHDHRWGMTVPEVKANEKASVSWELHAPTLNLGEDRLGYYKTVEGLETFVSYTFTDNQLTNTKYIFEPGHQEEVQYLENYETVKNWITRTYGSPKSEEVIWLDDLYKYAEELWGKAVVRGHLTMVAEWEVEGTSIVLLLNGGDENIGLVADFSSQDSSLPQQLVSLPARNTDL